MIWHGPMRGTLHGRDEVWERFYVPLWGDDLPGRSEAHDYLDNGEHAVGLSEVTFDLPDGPRTFKIVEVVHYDDAGRITERWAFLDKPEEFLEVTRSIVD